MIEFNEMTEEIYHDIADQYGEKLPDDLQQKYENGGF